MSKPTDKKANDQHFWRALQKDSPDTGASPPGLIDLTADLSELSTEEREHRRRALRSMLATSQARQQKALRNRLPPLTPGLVVLIKSGEFERQHGEVLDADYIHSRALLAIEGESEGKWVELARIAPLLEDD